MLVFKSVAHLENHLRRINKLVNFYSLEYCLSLKRKKRRLRGKYRAQVQQKLELKI